MTYPPLKGMEVDFDLNAGKASTRSAAGSIAGSAAASSSAAVKTSSVPALKAIIGEGAWGMTASEACAYLVGYAFQSTTQDPHEHLADVITDIDQVMNGAIYDHDELDSLVYPNLSGATRRDWIEQLHANLSEAAWKWKDHFENTAINFHQKTSSQPAPQGDGGSGAPIVLDAVNPATVEPKDKALDAPGEQANAAAKYLPEKEPEGGTTFYNYREPPDKEASYRTPNKTTILADNTGKDAYRTWRVGLLAWLDVCATMHYRGCTVRTALLDSLGEKTRAKILKHFESTLPQKTVGDILKFLDIEYAMMSSYEDKNAIRIFENVKFRNEESLQVFIVRYISLFEKACAAGHIPSSSLPHELLSKVFARLDQFGSKEESKHLHGRLVGEIKAKEKEMARSMTHVEKHAYILTFLQEAAQAIEDLKFERAGMHSGAGGGGRNQNANAATGDRPKRRRGRGKGKGTTTTTTSKEVNAATEEGPPAKKQKQNDAPPKQGGKATPAAASTAAGGAGAANHNCTVNYFFGKKGGKGKGKGKGKGAGGGKGGGKPKKKGGGKGQFDSTKPNPTPPPNWDKNNGDWTCKDCGCFNYKSKTHCHWCTKPKNPK